VRELHALGEPVGCVARDPSRVSFDPAVTVHRGDMLDPSSLSAIGDGYTTAYYLVHSMGRGGGMAFLALDRPDHTGRRGRCETIRRGALVDPDDLARVRFRSQAAGSRSRPD
jgi:uncharacterized protein YbjT (DUF2867 family)